MSRVVEEADLDFRRFRCCGDEDLYPFGCPRCERLMVFCYECDTLYGDLNDLGSLAFAGKVNNSDTTQPILSCPGCEYDFEYSFIRDNRYKVSIERWVTAGFGDLLRNNQV